MSDLRDLLDAEARRVRGKPEALEAVRRLADRRRQVRRIASGALALAIAAGGIGLAYAAFRPMNGARPARNPIPGPTPSPAPTPTVVEEFRLTVLNGSSQEGAAEVLAASFPLEVAFRHRLEPQIVPGGDSAGRYEVTQIFCHPNLEVLATRIRDAILPGAEIHGAISEDHMRIIVGEDFARENEELLAAYRVVAGFMDARRSGQGAEVYLSDQAARQFEGGEGGLSLYDYALERPWRVTGILQPDDSFRMVVRIAELGSARLAHELLTVGDADPKDGVLEILEAELNEAPTAAGPVGPSYDEVRNFVERFLAARRSASGAGAFLGEDARAAYAGGEGGLDLLGYAADDDLIAARIVRYDKLSPERHRVVVRFALADPDGSRRHVSETLLLNWRGGREFVVAQARAGEPTA